MSRIAKEPVELPKGVEFSMSGTTVTLKGSKGSLSMDLNSEVELSQDENKLQVQARSGSRFSVAMSGTTRALLANMVHGVTQGYERSLEIFGVGYKAEVRGRTLNLVLGYTHPINVDLPDGVDAEVDKSQTRVTIKGNDKQKVGQIAATVRGYKPCEPYKGKGVKYTDEIIRRKVGKAGAK